MLYIRLSRGKASARGVRSSENRAKVGTQKMARTLDIKSSEPKSEVRVRYRGGRRTLLATS